MERRKFTREFKLEAVRLIRDRGVSVAQASIDLGVHVSQLRNWVKKLAEDPQHAFPGHAVPINPRGDKAAGTRKHCTRRRPRSAADVGAGMLISMPRIDRCCLRTVNAPRNQGARDAGKGCMAFYSRRTRLGVSIEVTVAGEECSRHVASSAA